MKKVFILFALVGFATASFANTDKKANDTKDAEAKVEARLSIEEVAEMMGSEEAEIQHFFGMEQEMQTVKVYNAQDELIAEGTVDFAGMAQDAELAEALNSASRLMTIGDTHIYRTDN
ncbi:MAG TPA: hypothetical protein DCR93_32620 [Cytophagales bacterium]|nr:hypothetical protein [Cytophagales bacterium]HAP64033.1 hypothetical protein [Cytophagales bacterium]